MKNISVIWSTLNVPVHERQHRFTEVHSRMEEEEAILSKYAHASCNAEFRNNYERIRKKYGTLEEPGDVEMEDEGDVPRSPVKKRTRSNTGYLQTKVRCFVCDSERRVDGNSYNEGGLGRCSIESTAERLLERMKMYLCDRSHRLYTAANRLELLLSGQSHDIYAVDIYYHQSCYIKFVHSPISDKSAKEKLV